MVPLEEHGKLPDLIPLFKGHSAPVLDTDFNPFNDSVLASASEDGKVSMRPGLCFRRSLIQDLLMDYSVRFHCFGERGA